MEYLKQVQKSRQLLLLIGFAKFEILEKKVIPVVPKYLIK